MIWLSIEETARLMTTSPQSVRKLIRRNELTMRVAGKASNGKLRSEVLLESLPTKFQTRYFRLLKKETEGQGGCLLTGADVEVADSAPAASVLANLPEGEQQKIADYAEALRQIESGKRTKESAAKEFGVHVRTIKLDLKNLRAEGVAALARKRRTDAGSSRIADTTVIAKIQAEYLQAHRPRIVHVHREIAKDYELSGKKAPSYSFVRRVIESISPDLVARFRIGEREFDDKYAYISFRRKPELPRQWVQTDHHPCDHQVLFPDGAVGRPWITVLYDLCTNEITGFQLTREKPVGKGTYPGAAAIGLTLRAAILKKNDPKWRSFGVFDHLHADLGKDFRSTYVRGVCADLGIEINYTRGYHGKSKGNIEGWFGIMENGTRNLPGYCGNSPENNPQRQTLKPEPLDRKKLLTIDQYENALRDWIVNDYHYRSSKALNGLSPMEALEAHVKNGFSPRAVRDQRVLDLLLMRRKGAPVKVHNFGVQIFGRAFMARELLYIVGQEIDGVFWDPANVGEILLYQRGKFICTAKNKELLDFGASEEDLNRERELKRLQKRSIQERYEEILKQAQYPNPLARATAERRREKIIEEERVKIAAGAQADSVPLLVPKFAKAVKLRAVSPLRAAPSRAENPESAVQMNPFLIEEELPSVFTKREKNPFLNDEEETPEACHECGATEFSGFLLYCLECVVEAGAYCPKCHGRSGHRFCGECRNTHAHLAANAIAPQPEGDHD